MKRILAIFLCVSLLLTVCPKAALADLDEYGEDPACAEEPYLEGGTIYDLKNETDKAYEPEENIAFEPEDETWDDEPDVYSNYSFDAENTRQLQGLHAEGEIIVKFKEPAQVPGKEKQLKHEIEKVEKIGFVERLDVYVVRADDLGKNPNAVLNRFKNNKYVEYVEPNYLVSLDYTPTDPSYKLYQSTAMNMLNAPAGWDIIMGSSSAVVAVVDSGVAANPDLPPIYGGYAATLGLSYSNDRLLHGTGVAGVIGSIGDNGIGGAGLNWSASIMAVKVDDATGCLPIANVAKGIIWAADNGAKIINLSLGTTSDSATMKNAIDYAYKKGCAIFAATGNAGKNGVDYPAKYPNVMAVGSYSNGGRAATSNYGVGLDVLGLNAYYTTQASGSSGNSAGTSFAAPQAAGLASLLWGINPKLTNDQVYNLIRQGASGGGKYISDEVGYGLIDIGRTLELALEAGGNGTPTENPQEGRTPPVIALTGFTELSLAYGQAYSEMGFSAVDCKGDDLTSSVNITSTVDIWKAGLYTVTYEVADSAGLSARAARTVSVGPKPADPPRPEAPKISIIGSNPIILHSTSSTTYKEQGAKAVDGDGKDITNLVKIIGAVSRDVPGIYPITYSVTSPTTGLTATTSRNVRIVAPTIKKDPRTQYGFSGQGKSGAKITHTGVVSSSLGFMDLTVSSIDKNMKITVQLVDNATKKAVLSDTFTAAGNKQYKIEAGKYELAVAIDNANGNSKYSLDLLMPETGSVQVFNEEEVPLACLPQIAPIGSNPIILHIGGTPYFEQGARAVDYLGDDISGSVRIEGAPDTKVAGTYTISYTVIGAMGVPVSATREVRVLDPNDKTAIFEDEIPMSEEPGMVIYTVEKGDNLTRIACNFYGDGTRWPEIYSINKDVIGSNPNLIYPGQTLMIKMD